MKFRLLVAVTAICFAAGTGFSSDQRSGENAERWTKFKNEMNTPPAGDLVEMAKQGKQRELNQIYEAWGKRRMEVAWNYYRSYPDDPKRWEAAATFIVVKPHFYKNYFPQFDLKPGFDSAELDEEAEARWRGRVEEMAAAIEKSNASADAKEFFLGHYLESHWAIEIRDIKRRGESISPEQWNRYREQALRHIDRFRELPAAASAMKNYVRNVRSYVGEAAEEKEWQYFTESPNQRARDIARVQVRWNELSKAPVDLAFQALDGRRVDLARLRGKVILIDFWATWCGPCIAKFPELVGLREKYGKDGFVILGISMDKSPKSGAPQSFDKSGSEVLAFATAKGADWPQFYDGKYWENEIAKKFGVYEAPTVLLVGRDGYLAERPPAVGRPLELAIEKLLRTEKAAD